MSRSGKIKRRIVSFDIIYNSRLVSRLINYVMKNGQKQTAQKQVYRTMEIIKEKAEGNDPLKILEQSVALVGPKMEVRARRIGGASYQIPVEVRNDRRISLAFRWLIQAAKKRPNKEYHHFYQKLAGEILDSLNNQGEAVRKRDQAQRMAEANRAFAHLRW